MAIELLVANTAAYSLNQRVSIKLCVESAHDDHVHVQIAVTILDEFAIMVVLLSPMARLVGGR